MVEAEREYRRRTTPEISVMMPKKSRRDSLAIRLSLACFASAGGGGGIDRYATVLAARQKGICAQNIARQPTRGSRTPAMMAPQATPDVNAVLMQPKKTPRFSLLVISVTSMKATGVTAAAPMPVTTRPRMKARNELESEVIRRPKHWTATLAKT